MRSYRTGTTTSVTVEGTPCGRCEQTVRDVLREADGVTDVHVTREMGRVSVDGDADEGTLVGSIGDVGYTATSERRCSVSAGTIRRPVGSSYVRRRSDVEPLSENDRRRTGQYHEHSLGPRHSGGADQPTVHDGAHDRRMAHRSHAGDHRAHTDHSGHERRSAGGSGSARLPIPVIVFGEFVQDVLGSTAPTFPGSAWTTPVLPVVIFAYGSVPFLPTTRTEVHNRDPGMMLVPLAITVAFVYSVASLFVGGTTPFLRGLVTLIDVALLGHWMEMCSARQASGALDELAKLVPDTAERGTEDGDTEAVPVSALSEGDVLLVRPGASVRALALVGDGEVVEGESSVDGSTITGESRPVDKGPGAEVVAGTVNRDGSLRVRVTKTDEETTLAGITRLVGEARGSGPERIVRRS